MLRSCGIYFLRISSEASLPCPQIPFFTHLTQLKNLNNDTTACLKYWRKPAFVGGSRFCSTALCGGCDVDFAGNQGAKSVAESTAQLFKENTKSLHGKLLSRANMNPTKQTTATPVVASATSEVLKPRSDARLAVHSCETHEGVIVEDAGGDVLQGKNEKTRLKRKDNHMASLPPVAKRSGQKVQRSIDSFNLCSKKPPTSFSPSPASAVIRSSVLQCGPLGPLDPIPVSFLTWNVNGLLPRVRASQWMQFADYVKEIKPDVICMQEIRLPAMGPAGCRKNDGQPRERGAVRAEAAGAASAAEKREVETIASSLRAALNALPDYNVLMSLADWKYSGQFLLLRKHLRVESIRYNLNEKDPSIHHTEGRVIVADFGCFAFLTTYSPNNGWAEGSFQRRRNWDEALLKFMQQKKKPLIWMGDVNCAPTDADLSHPKIFRSAHQPDPNLKPEDVGQPGCTDAERKRLQDILEAGKLVDVYRHRNPRVTPAPVQEPAYTWRGYSEDRSPSSARAMRLDHAFASEDLLSSVTSVDIVGEAFPRRRFFGSDHCPVLLRLSETALRSLCSTK